MVEVSSPALKKSLTLNRIIGNIKGHNTGPTIVLFGGIHGNETAGVFALNDVFSLLNPEHISGTLYAITGNTEALKQNKRYFKSS